MYKAIPDNVHSPNFSVKRVSSKEEADWYNSQKSRVLSSLSILLIRMFLTFIHATETL